MQTIKGNQRSGRSNQLDNLFRPECRG